MGAVCKDGSLFNDGGRVREEFPIRKMRAGAIRKPDCPAMFEDTRKMLLDAAGRNG